MPSTSNLVASARRIYRHARPLYVPIINRLRGPVEPAEPPPPPPPDPETMFRQAYSAFFENHAVSNLETDDPNLRALLDDGVVALEGYFGADVVRAEHDTCLPVARQVEADQAEAAWEVRRYAEDGIFRVQNIEDVAPSVTRLTRDNYLLDLARQYLGNVQLNQQAYLDFKPDPLAFDETSAPHMDLWQSKIKIFILLNDVTERQAPFVYWKKSHLAHDWRESMDRGYYFADPVGINGNCPPGLLRQKCTEGSPALERAQYTGSAGTVLIADTRGFHRASQLLEGYRLQVVVDLEPPRQHG